MQSASEMQADFNALQLDIDQIHWGLAALERNLGSSGFVTIKDVASKYNLVFQSLEDMDMSVLTLLNLIRDKMTVLNEQIRHQAEIDRIGHVPSRMLTGEPPRRDFCEPGPKVSGKTVV